VDASTSRPGAGTSFEITRVFQAPRSRVWDAWSDGALFGQWWGPKGCAVQVSRFEFRPGGLTHYAMQFDGAPPMWGRFSYREVTPQQRIVWLNAFANDRCGIARAPFSELCPLEIENTATFSEQAGATTILLRAVPFGASPEEVGFFAELCNSGSLAQGYGGTFDQLAEHLG
jgi:uncharacterized protein YndB with AHSA1/START domain